MNKGALELLAPAEREGFLLLMLEQLEVTNDAFRHLRLRLIAGLFSLYQLTGYFAKALAWSDRLERELPEDGQIATELLSCRDQLDIIYVWLELDRRDASHKLAQGLVEICRAVLVQAGVTAERLRDVSVTLFKLAVVARRTGDPVLARTRATASEAAMAIVAARLGSARHQRKRSWNAVAHGSRI